MPGPTPSRPTPARPTPTPAAGAPRPGRRLRAGAATLLVVFIGASAAGCGGGDDSGSPAAPTAASAPGPGRDDFLAAANGLCDQFNQQMAAIGDKLGDDASLEDLVAAYRDQALPALRQTVVRIRALGFPAGDDAALRTLFGDVDAAIDRVQADPEKELQASNDPFESVNQRLTHYGLDHCTP
jgi:hypothetical protein